MSRLKTNLPTLIAMTMLAALVAGPALSHDADGGGHDAFAHEAESSDKVDGKHAVGFGASKAARKGKLVATSPTSGLLPNNIIDRAPDSNKLDGLSSEDFYRAGSTVDNSALFGGEAPDAYVSDEDPLLINTIGGWQTTSPSTSLVSLSPAAIEYNRSSAGDSIFFQYPELPSGLYGRAIRLVGVQYCYDANGGNVALSKVTLKMMSYSVTTGAQFVEVNDSDDTDRTDDRCHVLETTGNFTHMAHNTVVSLEMKFTTTTGANFAIKPTTYILEVTDSSTDTPTEQ